MHESEAGSREFRASRKAPAALRDETGGGRNGIRSAGHRSFMQTQITRPPFHIL